MSCLLAMTSIVGNRRTGERTVEFIYDFKICYVMFVTQLFTTNIKVVMQMPTFVCLRNPESGR